MEERSKRNKWLVPVLVLVSIVLAAGMVFAAYRYNQSQKKLKDPQQAKQEEANDLVGDVGKLIELPTGETPTIATVNDAGRVKGQAFFANAQNGDKVLIYSKARKAYLYRPSTGKLIEVAKLNLDKNGTTTAE